jgi:hypothetical protein
VVFLVRVCGGVVFLAALDHCEVDGALDFSAQTLLVLLLSDVVSELLACEYWVKLE